MHSLDKQEAWFALGDALNIERPGDTDNRPAIDPALPAKYHAALLSNTGAIQEVLRDKRGLLPETLKIGRAHV